MKVSCFNEDLNDCFLRQNEQDGLVWAGLSPLSGLKSVWIDEDVEMDRLKDKVILVTGVARGIGESIARAMASEGGTLIFSDLKWAEARRSA
jgi:hypothetical protein